MTNTNSKATEALADRIRLTDLTAAGNHDRGGALMAPRDTFLGHCKACKAGRRFVAPVTRQVKASLGYGRYEYRTFRRLPDGREVQAYDRVFLPCSCGTRRMTEFGLLRGRTSEHTCDDRCVTATGFLCECSCGGANHGAAHTA